MRSFLRRSMHEYHEVKDKKFLSRRQKSATHYEEILREDSDKVDFKGLISYLKKGFMKSVDVVVRKISGKNEDTLVDKLKGCSIVFETLENESYFLEVSVHERLHEEEFIVQGNLYEKTNGHYSVDNIIEAPRMTFVGDESRTKAYGFASDFISDVSAEYGLD